MRLHAARRFLGGDSWRLALGSHGASYLAQALSASETRKESVLHAPRQAARGSSRGHRSTRATPSPRPPSPQASQAGKGKREERLVVTFPPPCLRGGGPGGWGCARRASLPAGRGARGVGLREESEPACGAGGQGGGVARRERACLRGGGPGGMAGGVARRERACLRGGGPGGWGCAKRARWIALKAFLF